MRVRVGYFLSLVLVVFLFAYSFPVHAQGYEVDSILMCDDIDNITSEPVGLGEIYLTHSGNAYCWVNLTDITESLVVRFDWFNTVEELYESHQTTTEYLGSGRARAYDYIEIDGYPPSSDPGKWIVEIYVDDEWIGTESFSIIDYAAIIQKTDELESQVADILIYFIELESNIETVHADYEELRSEYNELFDTYNDLTISYEEQISEYSTILSVNDLLQEEYNSLSEDYDELILTTNQLNDEYDALVNDYESVAAQRSNSRNMMYASVAFALVSLAAAIYLYTKK